MFLKRISPNYYKKCDICNKDTGSRRRDYCSAECRKVRRSFVVKRQPQWMSLSVRERGLKQSVPKRRSRISSIDPGIVILADRVTKVGAAEAAREHGLTRCAVIGRLWRRNISSVKT